LWNAPKPWTMPRAWSYSYTFLPRPNGAFSRYNLWSRKGLHSDGYAIGLAMPTRRCRRIEIQIPSFPSQATSNSSWTPASLTLCLAEPFVTCSTASPPGRAEGLGKSLRQGSRRYAHPSLHRQCFRQDRTGKSLTRTLLKRQKPVRDTSPAFGYGDGAAATYSSTQLPTQYHGR
jgi:hypothetical protein